jgi:hypothetical protein
VLGQRLGQGLTQLPVQRIQPAGALDQSTESARCRHTKGRLGW